MHYPSAFKRRNGDSMSEGISVKRMKFLSDDDTSEGGISDSSGGVSVPDEKLSNAEPGFHVNEEYARRFEHNKKREELQRCKYIRAAMWA